MPYSFRLGDGKVAYDLIQTMQRAAAELNERTNVCWVHVPESEARVYIIPSEVRNVNSATLGYRNSWQNPGFIKMYDVHYGVALHEMCHVLGLFHEHQRPDRDEYVTIYPHNIEPKYLYAFDKFSSEDDSLVYDTPYDLMSIMQYGTYAFSVKNRPTITQASGDPIPLGERRLSEWDVEDINRMYPGITRKDCAARVAAHRPDRIDVKIVPAANERARVLCTMDQVVLHAIPQDSLQNANRYRWTSEFGSPREAFGSTYPVTFLRQGPQTVYLEVGNGDLQASYSYQVDVTLAGVQLSVAPNLVARGTPIRATVRTTSPDYRLRLIGADGRAHFTDEVTDAYCEEVRTLPTAGLAAGVYFLQAFLDGKWQTERVVIN